MRLSTVLAGVSALVMGAVGVQQASATFHFMQIYQVIGGVNGDTSAQAIELRMRTGFQNFVASAKMWAWDATGANPVLLIDFPSNVAFEACGRRVLITSSGFDAQTSPGTTPDFVLANLIPASYLPAGSITFESNSGIIYWRLSWGGAGYTGPTTGTITNDADGDFGPPWPGPLPSTDLQALLFQGICSALSTTNAADYALTGVPAVFRNNAAQDFTVTGLPVGACCDDATSTCTPDLTELDCLNMGVDFRYGGDGSTCANIDPPCEASGACCTSPPAPTCQNTTQSQCADTFFEGEDCASFQCPECASDADCDDGVACTTNECASGRCVFTAGVTCGLGEACNTTTGLCELAVEIVLKPVASGLCSPVDLTHAGDGSGRLFIVDQCGTIRVVDAGGALLPTPFLDITALIPVLNTFFDERGLLGLAFHPDYANPNNGRFFVRYSAPRAGDPSEPCFGTSRGCHKEVLAEYLVSVGDPNVADPGSAIILFEVDEPQFNHDAGQVAFGPDGFLYFTLGDGGGAHDGLADVPPSHGPDGNGQNTATTLGSVLRIDVGAGAVLPDDFPGDPNRNYAIPLDNPFEGGGGAPEIYAYGFRNPYKFSFDDGPGGDGSLYVADVGQNLFEEVDIVTNGGNYGWVIREGFYCFDPFAPLSPPGACANTGASGESLLDPVMQYEHPVGIAIIGGYVYRGSQIPALVGKYIFGDFTTDFVTPAGRLFYSDTFGPNAFVRAEFILPGGLPLGRFLHGLGEGEDGAIYVLATDELAPVGTSGVVLRINAPPGEVIPTVSEWGLVVMALLALTVGTIAFRRPEHASA